MRWLLCLAFMWQLCFLLGFRLRVAPLSFTPLCVTHCKTSRKKLHATVWKREYCWSNHDSVLWEAKAICGMTLLWVIALALCYESVKSGTRTIACIAGGISRVRAFALVAKPWMRVAKPWEDWWRVQLNSRREFHSRLCRSRNPSRALWRLHRRALAHSRISPATQATKTKEIETNNNNNKLDKRNKITNHKPVKKLTQFAPRMYGTLFLPLVLVYLLRTSKGNFPWKVY